MRTDYHIPPFLGGRFHPLRTLIVDDSPILLAALHRFLDMEATVLVIGTAANGHEALCKADALVPDLVVMDLNMPGMDGLEATAQLRRRLRNTRIIILTLDQTDKAKAAAQAHGAHGFVRKTELNAALMKEIRRVFLLNDVADEEGAL